MLKIPCLKSKYNLVKIPQVNLQFFFRPVQYRAIHTTCISPTNEVSTKTFFTREVVMTYPLLTIMFDVIR